MRASTTSVITELILNHIRKFLSNYLANEARLLAHIDCVIMLKVEMSQRSGLTIGLLWKGGFLAFFCFTT